MISIKTENFINAIFNVLREIICHSISLDLIFLFLNKMPNLVPAHLFAIRGSRKRGEIFFFKIALGTRFENVPFPMGDTIGKADWDVWVKWIFCFDFLVFKMAAMESCI